MDKKLFLENLDGFKTSGFAFDCPTLVGRVVGNIEDVFASIEREEYDNADGYLDDNNFDCVCGYSETYEIFKEAIVCPRIALDFDDFLQEFGIMIDGKKTTFDNAAMMYVNHLIDCETREFFESLSE